MGHEPVEEDRFDRLAANYDRWIDWGPRLQKEMPFLLASLPPDFEMRDAPFPGTIGGILDVGCGTGAHALALAMAGHRVVGVDRSESMIQQARESEARGTPARPVEWIAGNISDSTVLSGRWFRGVMALGNVLLAFGDEAEVFDGLESMVRLIAPGGTLVLQYLNGSRIRAGGRIVVKASPAPSEGDEEIWLRHHFEAGGDLYFHSYVLKREKGTWTADLQAHKLVDLPPERILSVLSPRFDSVEFFDGLSGRPFDPTTSDAVGVRASGRR